MHAVSPGQDPLVAGGRDLPPRWDGIPVQWGSWDHRLVHMCPPGEPGRCDICGSRSQPATCAGRSRDRFRSLYLQAARCPDCGHDQVLDIVDGSLWDLDEADYSDRGSWG